MKKIVLKYIAGLLVILTSLSACDDHLTQVNPNEITTGSFWKTLQDCEMGLVSVYNQFTNTGIMQLTAETNRSDLSWPGWGRPNTSNQAYLQTFNSATEAVNQKWDALYKGIFRANQVIEGLNGIESEMNTDEEIAQWTRIMAQARFFRGLFHFYLYNSFNNGSVIIYNFVPKSEADFYQTLSAPAEVQAFYLADLEYAHDNLPETYSDYTDKANTVLDGFRGRILKGAATSVLGKSYLYDADYTTAASYFEEVINSGVYSLADISENGTTKGEFNSESILEVAYDASFKPEYDEYSPFGTTNAIAKLLAPPTVGGWRSLYPSSWLIMEYKRDSIDINDPRNTIVESDGSTHYRKYSLRTSNSIALVDDEDMMYYGKRPAIATIFNNAETAYFRKNTNWDITDNEKNLTPPARSGINYRVIRLADVYLMYAECLIQGGAGGDVAKALRYINKVRHRAGVILLGTPDEFGGANHDLKAYTAQDVMNHLMYVERPLELACEGHAIRHLDLRRWGIKKQRLEELAQKVYHRDNYATVDEEGKALTRWGSVLQEGPGGGEIRDYQQSALNYNDELHAYWPIPNSETTANPSVN